MASVAENRRKWTDYFWDQEGHEWSPGGTRVGTEMLWWRSLRPRLHGLLPAGTLLEIAPGFGRWTEYLLRESQELIGVDATERCVEVCRERFAGKPARFSVNDGRTLPMVAAASVDAVFSFDSLVHVEAPEIASYLHEIARCLKPGGMGFLHHSNLQAYADPSTGRIPSYVTRKGWRAPTMSAHAFREECRRAGLECIAQEMITWRIRGRRAYRLGGDQLPLSDCLSTFIKPLRRGDGAPTKVYVNRHFVSEWDQLTTLGALYCSHVTGGASGGKAQGGAASASRRHAWSAASAVRPVVKAWSVARGRVARRVLAMREPIVVTLAAGRCPDCSGRLRTGDGGMQCAACHVTFVAP